MAETTMSEKAKLAVELVEPSIKNMILMGLASLRMCILVVQRDDVRLASGHHFTILHEHHIGGEHLGKREDFKKDAQAIAESWATTGNQSAGVSSSSVIAVVTIGTNSPMNTAISGAILAYLGGLIRTETQRSSEVAANSA